jgi:hypothetical protein
LRIEADLSEHEEVDGVDGGKSFSGRKKWRRGDDVVTSHSAA